MAGTTGRQGRISPSELYRQIENDNILEVTIVGDSEVRGEFRSTVEVDNALVNEFVTNIVPGAAADLARELREQEVEVDARAEPTGLLPVIVTFLPWILIIFVWIWILRSMQAGGNRAFQFGRSRARLISPDTPQGTFADVAGAEEAKAELAEIIEFLKDPPRYSRLGGRLPKGVLLVGPPGTGQNASGESGGGRGGEALLPDVGIGLRGDGSWGWAHPGCATSSSRGRRMRRA